RAATPAPGGSACIHALLKMIQGPSRPSQCAMIRHDFDCAARQIEECGGKAGQILQSLSTDNRTRRESHPVEGESAGGQSRPAIATRPPPYRFLQRTEGGIRVPACPSD